MPPICGSALIFRNISISSVIISRFIELDLPLSSVIIASLSFIVVLIVCIRYFTSWLNIPRARFPSVSIPSITIL